MKILIWVIVALVIVGGLAWFLSSNASTDSTNSNQETDQLTENGRTLDTDTHVFEEIEESVSTLE